MLRAPIRAKLARRRGASGRGVMMVLEGRTYHGSLTLSSAAPRVDRPDRWTAGGPGWSEREKGGRAVNSILGDLKDLERKEEKDEKVQDLGLS